ncbi:MULTISPECIES: glycoside hydrolase family 43 C-terminal domain-containing protein [unclassified Niallia]|uniref:lipocalin-like domain-containing protein n=1 Tax=unclassified Niallia TaxID=2837522 RepID=UPI0024A7602C|nr:MULTISPECIES: glycoside hydrolase family 43 C-terminal domain-containing protein [unclassified Niallia]MDL0435554.1 family 43 glycosylhydrolase [Niallia sp. SS-2023]
MKRNGSRRFLMFFLAVVLVIPQFFLLSTNSAVVKAATEPVFKRASVHDPSVIEADGEFYVFGSHLASAKTKDFMQWEQVSSTVSAENPLFENVLEELKETFDWAESDTLWAADVIQLEDGKYYMYYNACKGDSPRSALGVAVSDSVDGPYKDLGIILKSGMWDEESEDGTIYDATKHPNAVDPDVFFDKNGKLWMVYGSYSGGIFILEMDPVTGKQLPGQGYGKKLLGGNHSRIEGAYIQYSKETDYYYMYLSFGGLDSTGGYNMRVVRSKTPDGPYYDAAGNDMTNVKADPTLPLFDDKSIEPYGVKLMGSYLFKREIGESGTGIGTGYVSPGHNSVYYDESTDEQYLIFHTRFPERGEQHELRVHKMYMNDEAWPVVSPYEYAGESLQDVAAADISGDYKFINHGKDISADIKQSVLISLNNDGSITGQVSGTWKEQGSNKAELTIDGKVYNGVFVSQWDPTSKSNVMTFTATSDEGVSVWGSKAESKSDEEIVEAVKAGLDLGDTTAVISNLKLVTEGLRGAVISWSSSNEEVVTSEGKVTRPTNGEAVKVTLTATITKGEATASKAFEITVLPEEQGKLAAHYAFEGDLKDSTGTQADGQPTGNLISNTGGTISYTEGKTGQGAIFDGASGVLLPKGLISSNKYSVSFWLNPEQLTNYTSAFFGAKTDANWISFVPKGNDAVSNNSMIWSNSDGWYDADAGTQIPVNEWSHIAFTVDNGQINIYINGEKAFSGTEFFNVFTDKNALFALGVNYWDTPFKGLMDEVLVYDSVALTEDAVKDYYTTGTIPVVAEPETPAPDDEEEIDKPDENGTPSPEDGTDKPDDNGSQESGGNDTNDNEEGSSNTTEDGEKDSVKGEGHGLPNTATNSFNYLLAGIAMIVIGACAFLFKKKRARIE